MVEVPDSTTRYIQSDTGKPTKDLFNWMHSISQQLASILSGTAGGLFSSGLPCFSVVHSTTQSLANGAYTSLAFDTDVYHVGNFFASNAWTPPSGKVHLAGNWGADSATFNSYGLVAAAIFKNGVIRKQALGVSFGTAFGACHVACDDIANGTDVFTFRAFVSLSAGTATARSTADMTWFTGHWISP